MGLTAEAAEEYRGELSGYCYRMLGSVFDADEAVQETMVRAWRHGAEFEGRSSARTWLYRVATNVCLDMARQRGRRAVPMDLGPPSTVAGLSEKDFERSELPWVTPSPTPEAAAQSREAVRLAFVAALQRLPGRQRAVLILREVLDWSAAEVAELLGASVAAVNSALQRARATVAAPAAERGLSAEDRALVARYVDAFERYDIEALVGLLHADAVQCMPPLPLWLRGAAEVRAFFEGPGRECAGSVLLPTAANGCAAFGQYRPAPGGGYAPWSLHVLELSGDRVSGLFHFLEPALFTRFGLPPRLTDDFRDRPSSTGHD